MGSFIEQETRDKMAQVPYGNQISYGIPDGQDTIAHPQLKQHNLETQEIRYMHFDYLDFADALDCLSNRAAPGPDGVSASMLKGAKTTISLLLCNIFRSSYETGDIPAILKLATIIPIHKGGSSSEPSNFRPILLTSHIIKTL